MNSIALASLALQASVALIGLVAIAVMRVR